jgi:hypothetical protein
VPTPGFGVADRVGVARLTSGFGTYGLQFTKGDRISEPKRRLKQFQDLRIYRNLPCNGLSNIYKGLSDRYFWRRSNSHDNVNLHLQILLGSHRGPRVTRIVYRLQRLKLLDVRSDLGDSQCQGRQ